jgi:protein gp37
VSSGTSIEWTDCTWVVTTGCTEASKGCANCYARVMSRRLAGMAAADHAKGKDPGRKGTYSLAVADDGRWTGVVTPVEAALADPLSWRTPRMVFVNSMSDLFWGTERDLAEAKRRGVADPKPVPFEFIDRVFAVMALCPRHTFQVLTKRPERMAEYFARRGVSTVALSTMLELAPKGMKVSDSGLNIKDGHWELANVWLGTSCEDQAAADARVPQLIKCPAAVRFVSAEPLLSRIDLRSLRGIHWVIAGGESGAGARPCDVAWVRSVVEQCRAAGVPCFVKQLGAVPVMADPDATLHGWGKGVSWDIPRATLSKVTHNPPDGAIELKDRKGGDMAEWRADLRVREFPAEVRA